MINQFNLECGCGFTRDAESRTFNQTSTCAAHEPLSFGGSRAAAPQHGEPVTQVCNSKAMVIEQDPAIWAAWAEGKIERAFTFTKEELHWLLVTASTAHTELLLERRKCVQQRIDFNDQTMWVNRLREIDAEDPVIRSIVRKLERETP